MIFQVKSKLPKEQRIAHAIELLPDAPRHNAQVIQGFEPHNPRIIDEIKQLSQLRNIYSTHAMLHQINDDLLDVRMFSNRIAFVERELESVIEKYAPLPELSKLACGCGAKHTEENSLIYDPHFKKHFCLYCTTGHEMDD